jgi:hypothetical protein
MIKLLLLLKILNNRNSYLWHVCTKHYFVLNGKFTRTNTNASVGCFHKINDEYDGERNNKALPRNSFCIFFISVAN